MNRSAYQDVRVSLAARRAARGFSLVSAIFLVVVLSAMGAAMVNFTLVQHTSSMLDLQGSRAYEAARAGTEWGLYQALQGGQACPSGTFTPGASAAMLHDFTVTVTCTSSTYAGANGNITVRRLTSTACNKPSGTGTCPGAVGGSNYVQRVVQTEF